MNIRLIKLILSLCSAFPFAFMYDGWKAVLAYAVSFVCAYVAVNILFWLFVFTVALIAAIPVKKNKLSRFYGFILNTAIIEACSIVRIKIKVTGIEKLPSEPFLIVANHRSNFDNFVLSAVLKNPSLIFISKPSNFKIPFAGLLIKRCGYLAIDRENPRNALKTIHASAELIKNEGAYVGVFPEGTRGHENGVAAFSEGCFLIAKKAACPIVVASLYGTDNISKRFPRKNVVSLDILDVINTEKVKNKRSGELSDTAHNLITQSYLSK